jgi:hypothetical protein
VLKRVQRRLGAVVSALVLTSGLAVIATATPASAATFTVTNTNDAGPGSLRQALLDAGVAAVDSTISVSDDLDDQTIVLTSGELLYNPTGNNASITIEGNGVIVRQTAAARVLHLRTRGAVRLEEITMTGGRSATTGGAFINDFFNLRTVVVDSTFRGNQSNNDGGAIFVGAPFTAVRSTFTHNKVVKVTGTSESAAGAIGVVSTRGELAIVLEESTVTENSVQGSALDPDVGGGGLGAGGSIRIERSTVAENTVKAVGSPVVVAGGGVFGFSSVSVENSTVTDNSIQGPASAGGGIGLVQLEPQTAPLVQLVYSDIVDNSASKGGNLAVVDGSALRETAATEAEGEDIGLSVLQGNVGAAEDSSPVPFASRPTLEPFASVITEPGGDSDNCFGFDETDSSGWNFADDDSCDLEKDTDRGRESNDPRLGELAENGGPTETLLPAADSPLVNAIPAEECRDDDGDVDVEEDQRGEPRPAPDDPRCDIGSVEIASVVAAPPVVIEPTFTG